MENSIFIGSLVGPLMVILGVGLFFNVKMYQKMIQDLFREPIALFISAMVGFVVGLLMVQSNNIWETSWIVIITILGWAILIKSTLLLLFPQMFESIVKKCKFPNMMIQTAGIVYALLGAYIVYKVMM